MSALVLFVLVGVTLFAALRHEFRPCHGCCPTCNGIGGGVPDPETNGLCWDCRATGHGGPHLLGAAR